MDTKEREKLIADAAAEFEAGLRSKADQFEATRAVDVEGSKTETGIRLVPRCTISYMKNSLYG
jgi:hypothetical protein